MLKRYAFYVARVFSKKIAEMEQLKPASNADLVNVYFVDKHLRDRDSNKNFARNPVSINLLGVLNPFTCDRIGGVNQELIISKREINMEEFTTKNGAQKFLNVITIPVNIADFVVEDYKHITSNHIRMFPNCAMS